MTFIQSNFLMPSFQTICDADNSHPEFVGVECFFSSQCAKYFSVYVFFICWTSRLTTTVFGSHWTLRHCKKHFNAFTVQCHLLLSFSFCKTVGHFVCSVKTFLFRCAFCCSVSCRTRGPAFDFFHIHFAFKKAFH